MRAIVCVKQVPAVSELRFDNEKKTLIREGVHNEINPFDRRAITFAVETKRRARTAFNQKNHTKL
jgi:electron transfer flavoprotein beta subunit